MPPDEQTLLRAVIDNPEDAAPRLALAELWGGPRGAFIRAQIAASDALRAGGPAARPMFEAEKLLRGNHRAWAGPIADRVHQVRFLRGFPEWVVVEASTFVREWEAMFALAPIRHLDLVHARGVMAEVADCPGLERIVGLSFNLFGTTLNDPVGDEAAVALAASARLRGLRYLNLGDSKLSEAAMAEVAKSASFPSLEVGLLYGNALADFREDIGEDPQDVGYFMDVRPSPSMASFERKYGRRDWLHPCERKRRQVYREEI
jgi:uncharacterized protein (TIGR02996 family)